MQHEKPTNSSSGQIWQPHCSSCIGRCQQVPTAFLQYTICLRCCFVVHALSNDTMLHMVGHNAQEISLCQHHQADHALQNAEEHHMGLSGFWLGACGTSESHIVESCFCSNMTNDTMPAYWLASVESVVGCPVTCQHIVSSRLCIGETL